MNFIDNNQGDTTRCDFMSAKDLDVNFCFPVRDLESERVKLTPFIPSQHAEAFFAGPTPSFEYLPFGPFKSADEFVAVLIQGRIQPNPGCIIFAIYDKTKASETGVPDGAFAGTIGLLNTSVDNLFSEVGFVLVLPQFQRTHVTSNAIGLLLHYTLDLPHAGGLGLRRVEWRASPVNNPSVKAAERMGFRKDGILRWNTVLSEVKRTGNGRERRRGDPRENCLGRDTVVLSVCWDEWEDSVRGRVDVIMARRG